LTINPVILNYPSNNDESEATNNAPQPTAYIVR